MNSSQSQGKTGVKEKLAVITVQIAEQIKQQSAVYTAKKTKLTLIVRVVWTPVLTLKITSLTN